MIPSTTHHPILHKLANAIQNDPYATYDKQGFAISRLGVIRRIAAWLFGWTKDYRLKGLETVDRYLKQVEISKFKFNQKALAQEQLVEIERAIKSIEHSFSSYISKEKEGAKKSLSALKAKRADLRDRITLLKLQETDKKDVLLHQLNRLKATSDSTKQREQPTQHLLRNIQRRYLAIRYQAMTQDEIMKKCPSSYEADKAWLTNKLANWKRELWTANSADISNEEHLQINILCHYPELIELLKKDPVLRHDCLHLVFDNLKGVSPDAAHIYAQFPRIIHRLEKVYLDKKIGNIDIPTLKLHEERDQHIVKKEVSLRIEGRDEPILDKGYELEVGGQRETIQSIFQSFRNKNLEVGDFEFFRNGVLRAKVFNPSYIDFTQPTYYKDLPEWRIETRNELIKKYRDQVLQDFGIDLRTNTEVYTVVIPMASRSRPGISPIGCHAWARVYIPKEDGTYHLFAPGKYAIEYPRGFVEHLKFSTRSVPGTITLKDENEDYNHRQHIGKAVPVTKQEFDYFMELIRKDFIKAKEGRMYFQAQGNNCAHKVDKWFKKLFAYAVETKSPLLTSVQLPDLYKQAICRSDLPHPFQKIGRTLRRIPFIGKKVAHWARLMFGKVLGSHKGFITYKKHPDGRQIVKSLAQSPNWKKGLFYNPSYAFVQFKQTLSKDLEKSIV